MSRTGWAIVLGAFGAIGASGAACSSFEEAAREPGADAGEVRPAEAGPAPGPDGGAPSCTGTAEESDAAPSRNCNGDGLEIDLLSSDNHCGRCGRSCGGETCSGGLCKQTLVVPTSSGTLAANAQDLFWSSFGTSASVFRQPLAGGAPVALATTSGGNEGISAIAVDAARVYVNMQFGIVWVPLDSDGGAAPTRILDHANSRQGLAVDDTHVYWSRYNVIEQWPKDGSQAPSDVSSSDPTNFTVSGLVADAKGLYWTMTGVTPDGGAPTHRLYQRLAGGGDVQVRASGITEVHALALDAEHVYWGDWTGAIWRVARAGSAPPERFAAVAKDTYVRGLTTDATHVYWTANEPDGPGGRSYTGRMFRTPKCAGGLVEVVTADTMMVAPVLVDGTHAYHGALNGVVRVRK